MKNPTHSLLTEAYRPTQLSNYLGEPFLMEFIQDCITRNDIPHLLLYGAAGSGKTTLAKLLVKNINCDYIYINASKERNLDTVKDTITQFASSASFKPLKVVILDEGDFMNANSAQPALRGVMEEFSAKTRFIITCNYVDRIIDPIRSRCQEFAIVPPPMKLVAKHIIKILDKEEIKYDLYDVGEILTSCYPDIRRILNTIQKFTINKELRSPEISGIKIEEVINLITSKNWKGVRQYLADNDTVDYTFLYRGIYDNINKFPESKELAISILLAEYQFKEHNIPDKELNCLAFVAQIIKLL